MISSIMKFFTYVPLFIYTWKCKRAKFFVRYAYLGVMLRKYACVAVYAVTSGKKVRVAQKDMSHHVHDDFETDTFHFSFLSCGPSMDCEEAGQCIHVQGQGSFHPKIWPLALLDLAMASLYGVAKQWWSDPVIRDRLKEGGIQGLVCVSKANPIAAKDAWHVLQNKNVLTPVIECMRCVGLLKTPCLENIQEQVHVLDLLLKEQPMNAMNLPPIPPQMEVKYHVTSMSIKRLVSFTRRKRLLPHTPRDRVAKKSEITRKFRINVTQ